MIGDGMGTTQVYSALVAKDGDLEMGKSKHIGFSKTYSGSDFVTDSGAGGTALATGCKTFNRCVGMNMDRKPCQTILELAEQEGLATGLVATAAITHATPASFIAHNEKRSNYEAIALDFLNTDVDVFIGGGYNHFCKRRDQLNLGDSLTARGYTLVTKLNDLEDCNADRIAGLLYPKHPPKKKKRGEMLSIASTKAIDLLDKKDKGFFLMIEGSQIDWAGHENNTKYLVREAVDFDNVVGQVARWAEENGETLVIVTADHETGGFAILDGDLKKGKVKGEFTTNHHSGVMVPVFAFGPGAEYFQGIQENTEIFDKMVELLGLKDKAEKFAE